MQTLSNVIIDDFAHVLFIVHLEGFHLDIRIFSLAVFVAVSLCLFVCLCSLSFSQSLFFSLSLSISNNTGTMDNKCKYNY